MESACLWKITLMYLYRGTRRTFRKRRWVARMRSRNLLAGRQKRIQPQIWWDEIDDILRHVVQLLIGNSAASVRIDHQLIQMICRGRETKHPSSSTAESTTEKRNNCFTAQAAGGSIITSLGVSIHYKYNIWSHECVIPDINTIKLNHVFTRLLHWNTFNLMPYETHTQQWAVKITYRFNTHGVAFTRAVQIIGRLSTYVVCLESIRIGIAVVVHWVGCVCNQSWHVRTCLSNSWHKLQVAAFVQLTVVVRGSTTCVYVIAIFTM